MQKVGGVEVLWGVWLLAFLPCSIVTVLVAWRLTLWLCPPEQIAFAPDKAHFQNALETLLTNILSITAVLYWVAFIYHFLLASEISMLATSMPLVMEYAKTHGLNPLQLGLIWTFAAGGKLFAYQSGVLIVGYSYGYFEARDLIKIGAWLTVVEFVVLMLLVPFYWPLLGIH